MLATATQAGQIMVSEGSASDANNGSGYRLVALNGRTETAQKVPLALCLLFVPLDCDEISIRPR